MRLRLTEPTQLLVEREILAVQAEDESGRFGIREGHEPFLTALVPSILVWRYRPGDAPEPEERFAAIRGGLLRVEGNTVHVAARTVRLSEKLEDLEAVVQKARSQVEERTRKSVHSFYQMQIAAWRRLMEFKDVT